MKPNRQYTAIIERDNTTGYYVAYIPDLLGAHTQAETLEELQVNLKEVTQLVIDSSDQQGLGPETMFVGTQLVVV